MSPLDIVRGPANPVPKAGSHGPGDPPKTVVRFQVDARLHGLEMKFRILDFVGKPVMGA